MESGLRGTPVSEAAPRWRPRKLEAASSALGDALGIELGQPGFSEAALRLFDVVGHAAEFHAVRSRMIDHVTGPWVTIAWLPNAPDPDGVAGRE